jgi:enoyl-CoA hydratase
MPFVHILVEQDGPLGIVTLNRPKQLNALNWELVGELGDALEAFDRDDAIRCVIITGSGERAFAAGADIKEMAGATPVTMLTGAFEGWARIRRVHKPLIAAVNGYALGGGCELAMHCDIIIASENAQFGQPEINLGIIPGAGGTQRLARALGKYLAMEMVLTGRNFSAAELHRVGLVSRVVPVGELMTAARELGMQIAAKAPIAVRLAKESINAALETSLEEGLSIERRNFCLLFATEDQKEGMRAFVEKRPPEFQGR